MKEGKNLLKGSQILPRSRVSESFRCPQLTAFPIGFCNHPLRSVATVFVCKRCSTSRNVELVRFSNL